MKKHFISLLLVMAAVAFINRAYSQACPPGLVGYWKLDETSGSSLAETVSGYNSTLSYSDSRNVTGKIGKAQRFSYTVLENNCNPKTYTNFEYASMPDNAAFDFDGDESFTVSYWCNYSDYGYGCEDHIMVSKGDWKSGGAGPEGMFASGANGSGKINFLLRDNLGNGVDRDLESDNGFGAGWHHVACVRNASTNTSYLYVDGVLRDSRNDVNFTGSFGSSLGVQFGSLINNGVNKYFYKGDLDEVAIFSKALSLSEITTIISNAASGTGLCTVSNVAPTITSTAVTTGTIGAAYTYDVNATGTPSAITYSLTTPPAGMTINPSTGVISWTPASAGSFPVVVNATNGVSPNATQSFSVTVTGASPTITSTAVTSGLVGEAYSYDVQATGNPATFTFSLTTPPAGMTINPSTGVISWTPASAGSFPVVVNATNGVSPDATQSFSVTVTGASPTITSTAVTSGLVGEAYSYDVQATGNPATFTFSLTTPPAGMTINSSTGLISWTPASAGSYPVVVNADNGIDPDGTQSFTIVVTAGNPEITSTPITTAEVGALYNYTVQAAGTQTGMTFSLETKPAGMTINATSGLISWTPTAVGSFDVAVVADNGIAPTDAQSFSIAVSGASPNITSSPVTTGFINVGYSYTVVASGTQTGMTFSLETKPTGMTINATSGLISWTPTAVGSYAVDVIADNGIAPSDMQSYSLTIIEPTNCPNGIISLHRLDESAGPGYADFYDEHNAMATVSPTLTTGIIDNAQLFGASTGIDIPDNGTEYDWASSWSFSFECWVKTTNTAAMVIIGRNRTDYANATRWYVGTNSSGQATFHLHANGGSNTVVTGSSVITDGDWHHIVAVRDGSSNLNQLYVDNVREASQSFSFVNTFKADNPLVVTIGYLKDPAGEMHFIGAIDEVAIFDRAVASTEVNAFYNGGVPSGHCRGANNFPYFTTSPSTSVNEDVAYSYTANVTDPDADAVTISAVYKPAWMNFSYTAGQTSCVLSGTPSNSNVGDHDVVLRVTDDVMSRDQKFRVTVNNVNDAPYKTSTPTTSVNEGVAYSYTLTVNDIDAYPAADAITITKVTLPSWMTWTPGTRSVTISGTPDDPNVGANPIDITFTDGKIASPIHESYTLTVNQVNDAPAITAQSALSVNEDQNITILKSNFTIVDPDNSSSEITITVQSGTNYTFSGNTVTPAANYSGPLNVKVIASDLALSSQPYTATVTVNAVNDAPAITGQNTLSVNKNSSITILKSNLTIADVDNNLSDITITVQAGTNYTAVGNTVTPTTGFSGQISVNVIASDLSASSAAYPVLVSVVSVGNEPPVITAQIALSVNEDESKTILKENLTITDADNPATDLSIIVQDGTNYSHVNNIVTPALNFNGQLSVNVVARDLAVNSAVYHVIITVNPVNDKPVITSSPGLTIAAGSIYTYVLTATDVDNATITLSSIVIPGWLAFSSTNGLLAGTPSAANVGQHLVTLRVSDGIENVDITFTITVTGGATAIDEITEGAFVIYPSPANNELNIRFSNLTEETIVEIVSPAGAVIESRIIPAETGIANINVQDINAGVYFCHVRNNKMDKVQRFLIIR